MAEQLDKGVLLRRSFVDFVPLRGTNSTKLAPNAPARAPGTLTRPPSPAQCSPAPTQTRGATAIRHRLPFSPRPHVPHGAARLAAAAARYQACSAPQWGQSTEVVTAAVKA